MNELLTKYFSSRRQALLVLGVICAVLWLCLQIFYFYQRAQFKQAESDLAHLQNSAKIVVELQSALPSVASNDLNLEEVIAKTAEEQSIVVDKLESDEERLIVTLSPLPFNTLILWLGELQRDYLVEVVELEITSQDAKGIVIVKKLVILQVPSL